MQSSFALFCRPLMPSAVLVIVGFAGFAACKETAAEASKPSTIEAAHSAPAGVPTASVKRASFEVELLAAGPYRVSEVGEASVSLRAVGGYKVNDEYPHRFKLDPSDALDYPEPVVRGERVKVNGKQATFSVPLSAKRVGEHTLAGTLAFSVCTPERCLMEKVPLAVALKAE